MATRTSATVEAVDRKVDDWLGHGTLAVLVMYPKPRSAVLWRADGAVRLHGDVELNLDPAIPGFHCKLSELFPATLDELAAE